MTTILVVIGQSLSRSPCDMIQCYDHFCNGKWQKCHKTWSCDWGRDGWDVIGWSKCFTECTHPVMSTLTEAVVTLVIMRPVVKWGLPVFPHHMHIFIQYTQQTSGSWTNVIFGLMPMNIWNYRDILIIPPIILLVTSTHNNIIWLVQMFLPIEGYIYVAQHWTVSPWWSLSLVLLTVISLPG